MTIIYVSALISVIFFALALIKKKWILMWLSCMFFMPTCFYFYEILDIEKFPYLALIHIWCIACLLYAEGYELEE